MLLRILVLSFVYILSISSARSTENEEITFQNVLVRGYSIFINKFNVTITSSSNLKSEIPKNMIYDALEISNANIPVLYEDSITDFDNLDELLITSNDLNEIRPGAFKNLPELRKLLLKGNKLEVIKEGVFNNLKVSTLDLSGNQINHIDSNAFNNMSELLNINLNDNKIAIWEKNWFASTPLLSRISFQHNSIEELPDLAFANLGGVKKFGSIPLTINIILSSNKIRTIYGSAFQGLDKINNLWLDNNQIKSINPKWWDGIEIDELRIGYNLLTCLSGELDKIFVANISHIDGNPWNCECLERIENWAKTEMKDVQMFYSKLTCDSDRIAKKIEDLYSLINVVKNIDTEK